MPAQCSGSAPSGNKASGVSCAIPLEHSWEAARDSIPWSTRLATRLASRSSWSSSCFCCVIVLRAWSVVTGSHSSANLPACLCKDASTTLIVTILPPPAHDRWGMQNRIPSPNVNKIRPHRAAGGDMLRRLAPSVRSPPSGRVSRTISLHPRNQSGPARPGLCGPGRAGPGRDFLVRPVPESPNYWASTLNVIYMHLRSKTIFIYTNRETNACIHKQKMHMIITDRKHRANPTAGKYAKG